MCNKITLKSMFFCLSLLFFSLAPFCGSNLQAAQLYTISETQLTQLETNLNQLKTNNESKEKLLNKQEMQLTEAQNQLKIVNEQLQKSRDLNEATQKSLAEARKSFNEYEKEAERKIRIKTRQRNLWISIAGLLATVVIAK